MTGIRKRGLISRIGINKIDRTESTKEEEEEKVEENSKNRSSLYIQSCHQAAVWIFQKGFGYKNSQIKSKTLAQ